MVSVSTDNDQLAEVSASVLKMARKRGDPLLGYSSLSAAGVAGMSTGFRRLVDGAAGLTWFIGWPGERDLLNLLRTLKNNVPASIRSYLQRDGVRAATLQGMAHRDFMLNALDDAKHSVCILSGWLSKRVVDAEFMKCVGSAMDRGVDVFIGYGHQYKGDHAETGDSKVAASVLRTAAMDAGKRSVQGSLTVGKFATHEKVLLIDCAVLVTGSNNWLSNATHLNGESSLIVEHIQIARKECARLKSLIRKNVVISSRDN